MFKYGMLLNERIKIQLLTLLEFMYIDCHKLFFYIYSKTKTEPTMETLKEKTPKMCFVPASLDHKVKHQR